MFPYPNVELYKASKTIRKGRSSLHLDSLRCVNCADTALDLFA
jgi:hypothetical protein